MSTKPKSDNDLLLNIIPALYHDYENFPDSTPYLSIIAGGTGSSGTGTNNLLLDDIKNNTGLSNTNETSIISDLDDIKTNTDTSNTNEDSIIDDLDDIKTNTGLSNTNETTIISNLTNISSSSLASIINDTPQLQYLTNITDNTDLSNLNEEIINIHLANIASSSAASLTNDTSAISHLTTIASNTTPGTNAVKIIDGYGFTVEATPMDELRVVEPVRLVGATFVGNIVDSNFWTAATGSSGTVTSAGQLILTANTTANSSATAQSVRNARYVGASSNRFRTQLRLNNTGAAGNIRRWGCYNSTDGAFFELNGTTMYAVTRKTSVDIPVASSSWNNNTVVPTLSNINSYEIYYTNAKVYFVIAGTLKHTMSATLSLWTDTTNLPVRLENINSGSLGEAQVMNCRVATISRLGRLDTDTIYKNISGAVTTVLKYSPGRLHRIVTNTGAVVGGTINIYDNTAGNGAVIATIDSSKFNGFESVEYNCNFFNGLTFVTVGGATNLTVIYE